MEHSYISRWQFFLITLQVTLGNSMFMLTGVIVESGKQDSWLIPLIAGLFGLLLSLVWVYASKLHPGLSFVQIAVRTMGRPGWIAALALVWFFVYVCAWTIKNLGDVVNVTLLPISPSWMFQAMFILLAAYGVTKGIEAIARTVEFFVPILLLVFLLLTFIVSKEWKWDHFSPAFDTNMIEALAKSNIIFAFPFMEMICLTMLLPHVPKDAGKTLWSALCCASIILSMLVGYNIAILGVERTTHLTYPLFTMAQEMQISEFIEHIEALASSVLILSLFIKVVVYYYCAVVGLCQLFRIQRRGALALGLALYTTGLANSLTDNVIENMRWSNIYALPFSTIFAVFIPLMLVLAAKIRGIKRRSG